MLTRVLVALLVTLGVILLWPLEDPARWEINVNQERLLAKQQYLARLASLSPELQPNILLILADDLGKYDISLYGSSRLPTPNIDDIGRLGVTYDAAYATGAICAPSRAGLLTGRYQNRFGFESQPMQRYVRNLGEYLGFRYLIDTDEMRPFLSDGYPSKESLLQQGIPPSEITLGEFLGALGYRTGIFGKWHLGYGEGNHPNRTGFDEQYGFIEAFSLYAPPGADVVEYRHDLFWERHIRDMGRKGPSAITRNGRTIREDRYLTDAIVEEATGFMKQAISTGQPFFAYVPFSAPHTPFQARRPDYEAITDYRDDNERVYLAMIRRLDHGVGELIAFLDAVGELENTVIVFTSDNGGASYTGATDNGPLRAGKFTQFEGGLEVPLMIYWKDHVSPGLVSAPVILTDIFRTLAGILKVSLPGQRTYDSLDLLASDLQETATHRPLYWRSDFNRAIRFENWKLLQNTRDGTLRLYDLSADIGERNDLSGVRPGTVSRLLGLLDAWEKGLEAPKWPRVMNYRLNSDGEEYWFAI